MLLENTHSLVHSFIHLTYNSAWIIQHIFLEQSILIKKLSSYLVFLLGVNSTDISIYLKFDLKMVSVFSWLDIGHCLIQRLTEAGATVIWK